MMNRSRHYLIALAGTLAALALPQFSRASLPGGVDTTDPSLPPVIGAYLTPADVHAIYNGPGLTVVLSNVIHHPFADTTLRIPQGPDEIEQFDSSVTGDVSINGGPNQPVAGSGPVSVEVFGKTGHVTGTFDTEMLSMNLSLGGPVMIRESPTLPSLGQTSVTDIGGGLYHIDSFFDVFTELSLDGGNTWIPSDSSHRVILMPEPASLALLALGAVPFLSRRRRA